MTTSEDGILTVLAVAEKDPFADQGDLTARELLDQCQDLTLQELAE